MESNIDETSGRPLIEGRHAPIDGGVFRRKGEPGIVVDTKRFSNEPWFVQNTIELKAIKDSENWLSTLCYISRKTMPIRNFHYREVVGEGKTYDRYDLPNFVSRKDENGKEIGGGSPDSQALYTAVLLEWEIKNDEGREVWISKDPGDGHAIVNYTDRSGQYNYDPTSGETEFIKMKIASLESL